MLLKQFAVARLVCWFDGWVVDMVVGWEGIVEMTLDPGKRQKKRRYRILDILVEDHQHRSVLRTLLGERTMKQQVTEIIGENGKLFHAIFLIHFWQI